MCWHIVVVEEFIIFFNENEMKNFIINIIITIIIIKPLFKLGKTAKYYLACWPR